MFSGIVQNKTPLHIEQQKAQLKTFSVELTTSQQSALTIGASIALNGVCLTVTAIDQGRAYFDVMMETLRATNLGQLVSGSVVNTERAAKFGDDIGGHAMSGHVSSMVEVVDIIRPENNCIVWFKLEPEQRRFIFSKGFVGLNGCSLTVGEVLDDRFNVYLIPETLSATNFGETKVGDFINIEFDAQTQAIVETLTRMREAGEL